MGVLDTDVVHMQTTALRIHVVHTDVLDILKYLIRVIARHALVQRVKHVLALPVKHVLALPAKHATVLPAKHVQGRSAKHVRELPAKHVTQHTSG